MSGDWSPEQRQRVRALLLELTHGQDLPELRREAATWANSADLNEGWIAGLALQAGELLDELPG